MSIIYAMRLICDLYFYLSVVGILGALLHVSTWFLLLPALFGIGAGLSFRFFANRKILRYVPLALGLTVLITDHAIWQMILLLPPAVYSVMYIMNNRGVTDWYYAFDRFRFSLIPLGFLFVIGNFATPKGLANAVPILFVYLALSVTLLRILRHDEKVMRQRRFRVLNLTGIAVACLTGVALASEKVLALLKAVGALFVRWILTPLLDLLFLLITAVGWLIEKIASLFPRNGEPFELNMENMSASELLGEEGLQQMAETVYNPTFVFVVKAIGIVLAAVLVFFVLRALSRQAMRFTETKSREERETLEKDTEDTGGDGLRGILRRRSDPVLAVRHTYKRFLDRADTHGVPLNGCQNSLQVQHLSEAEFDKDPLSELREVYIRARYDGQADAEAVKQANTALSRIKKSK